MDSTVLESACRTAGMLDSAIADGVRRLEAHFAQQADPSAAIIAERLSVLREQAPHLFPREGTVSEAGVPQGVPESVWRHMAPSAKLAWAREHGHGLPPVERRPRPLMLSAEQAAALAKLPAQQRLDAYRELQRQAQQQP
jgi:hypothetical protein